MVEAKLLRHFPRVKKRNISGIVVGHWRARCMGEKDNTDGVFPGVAVRVRIHVELFNQADHQLSFFLSFADGSPFDRLPIVHKTTGDSPSEGFIAAFNQDDGAMGAIAQLNDDVHSGGGIAVGHEITT